MLSPAFTLGVYYLVFSVFLRNGIPNFVIYLFSGLVVWNMFQNSINTATGVIVDRAALVKKVSFPREILALSNVGAAVVYFVVQLAVLIIFVAAVGHAPAWHFILILPISFLVAVLLHVRAGHGDVGHQRLSARHEASHGGAAAAVVLAHAGGVLL